MLPAVKALWSGDYAHDGEFWSFPTATSVPKPLQHPHPPIWIAARAPVTFNYAVKNNCNIMSWAFTRPFSEVETWDVLQVSELKILSEVKIWKHQQRTLFCKLKSQEVHIGVSTGNPSSVYKYPKWKLSKCMMCFDCEAYSRSTQPANQGLDICRARIITVKVNFVIYVIV